VATLLLQGSGIAWRIALTINSPLVLHRGERELSLLMDDAAMQALDRVVTGNTLPA
jgi:hypothetical protein